MFSNVRYMESEKSDGHRNNKNRGNYFILMDLTHCQLPIEN